MQRGAAAIRGQGRRFALGLLRLSVCAIAFWLFEPASVQAQSAMRGTPVAFSSRALDAQHARVDSAGTLGAPSAAMSRRGQVVLLFALVGAGFAVLAVHDECAEIGCTTILSYPYAAVLGFGIGALVGWIITAL